VNKGATNMCSSTYTLPLTGTVLSVAGKQSFWH